MPPPTENSDWVTSLDLVVQRTPRTVLERGSLSAEVRLLGLLGSGAPLNVLLDGLVKYIETWSEGLYGSVLLADPSGLLLRPGAAPSLPAAYVRAIERVPIGEGIGSCGTAAARREMVIVEDVEQSELWRGIAPLALAHGLRACWSVPVLDDARGLLGSLAMYYREPRKPTEEEIALIQFAASLAAFVIQRHRDAERLRTREDLLRAAVWGTEMGLWECTEQDGYRWFDTWCEQLGIVPCTGRDACEQWYRQVHPEDIVRYRHSDDLCAKGRADHYSVEYRVRTRDSGWRWIHERGRVAARSSNGAPTRYVGVCLDIDRQKRTEAALRSAEDRYELAVNAAQLPVWEYEVASDTVRGNLHWHRAAGYDLTEEQARERTETWLSDIHPDDAPRHARAFRDPIADQAGFFESEFRIRQPGGEYRWLLDRGRVVEQSAGGDPLKIVGVSVDIDARKRMETVLRESEERFRSAFDFAAIGMALVAPDGRFLRVNQALCRIVGYSSEELLSRDVQAIRHPDDPGVQVQVSKMLDGELSYFETEKRYLHKSGRTVWVLLSVSLVRDDKNRPCYLVSQMQDITARKVAEAQLRESELRYRVTSELVPGFVFEGTVVDGLPQPTWASDGFERVFGCSLEEFKRLGIRRFCDAATRAQLRAGAALVARGEELRMDMNFQSAQGAQKWLRVLARAIPGENGGRVLGVAEDISEQNRLALALREATQNEQQRLGREIHDGLGQELTGLAYLAGSLARSAADSKAANAEDLAMLESIANQCIRTCRNIARGVSPLTESRGSLVEALRRLVAGVAAGGRMGIAFNTSENAPLTLPWVFRDHLYRIAQEAITNALRHSAGDAIVVTMEVEPKLVRVAITDNGRGLDPARAAAEGLGIDSMSQRAAAIGARLHVTTAPGGGAAVVCECPQTSPGAGELRSSTA